MYIKGIGQAAIDLGVSREHLSFIVHGQRKSPKLLKRFREWQAQRKKHTNAEAVMLSSLPTLRRDIDFLESPLNPSTTKNKRSQ